MGDVKRLVKIVRHIVDRYFRDRNFHELLGMLSAKRRLHQKVVGD